MNFLSPATVLPAKRLGAPRSTAGVEVPADRIGTVGLQCVKRIYRISFGFTHLLSVSHPVQTKNDNVLMQC